MKRSLQGQPVTLSAVEETAPAFVPAPLPPSPAIEWTPALRIRFDEALVALGRLDAVTLLRPEASTFLGLLARQEAVCSAALAGLAASFTDILLLEAGQTPEAPLADVREARNLVAALDHGLGLLRQGLPLSLRLFREIHTVMLADGRGRDPTPGEFRRGSDREELARPGAASLAPPPAAAVLECLGHLRLFLNDQPAPTPVLPKAALALAQIHVIHPFHDGNGRLGRVLAALLLNQARVLRTPMPGLSRFFLIHCRRCRDRLDGVRRDGDWEAWLDFFAEGVLAGAAWGLETIRRLLDLGARDTETIAGLGRPATSTLQVYRALLDRPIATANQLVARTGLTPATVNKALAHLEHAEIVRERTTRRRNRVFTCPAYLDILSAGLGLHPPTIP
jgi:Fic family protein